MRAEVKYSTVSSLRGTSMLALVDGKSRMRTLAVSYAGLVTYDDGLLDCDSAGEICTAHEGWSMIYH